MASLIMHIVTSKVIAEKYNLSDKFLAGSGMPDIYTKCNIDRDKTHYIDQETTNLPDYQRFLKENSNRLNDELILGYAAHLIEDYVWYSNFKNKYIRKISNDPPRVEYLKDGSIHEKNEFFINIYEDYNNIDNYLCEKYNISIDQLKDNISIYYTKYGSREKLYENLKLREFDPNRVNVFISHDDVDEFIEMSKNEVEKVLHKLLLEVNT